LIFGVNIIVEVNMAYQFDEIKGKTVIITGSGQGIGRGIAEMFADQGANLVISDINQETAQKAADEIAKKGVETIAVVCDVSKYDQVENLMAKAIEKWGKIDIVINNAGITMDTLFIRMKPEKFQKVLDVNLTGTFNGCSAAVKYMRKARSGCIVNISSIAAHGNVGQANYSASKAGVEGLTKTLGKELAPMGIRVNAIAPGFIKTAMTDAIPEEIRGNIVKSIPLGRPGETSDIANTILFLASDLASYITAQVVNVNGGVSGL